jgi:putative inorganic carbon (hco3(-)) transporter
MGFLLTCLSIILTYFSPAEIVPSLSPYHIQLVIMIFGLIVSVPVFSSRPIMGLQAPQYLLVLAFWAAIVLSQVTKLKIRWGWEGFYIFGSMVAIYFLIQINTFTLARIKMVAAAAAACGVVMGTQAILAYRTGYLADKLLLFPPGDDRAMFGNRVCGFGILHDPNDFAQFLLVCLALLGLFWKRGHGLRNVVLLTPPAAALLYAIYLTFSRGALLGVGAVLLAAVYRKGRNVVAIATAGLALPVLYALRFTGGREIAIDGSTTGRLIAWGAGLSYTIRHPLFGVGFGRFTQVNDLTAHNSFVLCFTELGLIGFFFWLALIYVTLSGLETLGNFFIHKPGEEAYVGAVYALRAAFFAFLTTAWFLSRTYTETLYILLALGASLIQLRGHLILKDRYRLSWWGPRTLRWAIIAIFAVFVMVKMKIFA